MKPALVPDQLLSPASGPRPIRSGCSARLPRPRDFTRGQSLRAAESTCPENTPSVSLDRGGSGQRAGCLPAPTPTEREAEAQREDVAGISVPSSPQGQAEAGTHSGGPGPPQQLPRPDGCLLPAPALTPASPPSAGRCHHCLIIDGDLADEGECGERWRAPRYGEAGPSWGSCGFSRLPVQVSLPCPGCLCPAPAWAGSVSQLRELRAPPGAWGQAPEWLGASSSSWVTRYRNSQLP